MRFATQLFWCHDINAVDGYLALMFVYRLGRLVVFRHWGLN